MRDLKTILYVDDDPDDREIFTEAINTFVPGFHLETAEDGCAALEKLETGDLPCCIYIDINMPKMNGIELLTAIKSNARYTTIPAFLLSTAMDPTAKKEASRLGAVEFLVKPTTFQGLRDLLKACFTDHICAPHHTV